MTDSPPGPVHQPGHRRWSTHLDPHHPSTREPPTFPLRLNSVRRPALASRTFGRFAVDPAGSIPDPNASSRRAQNRRRTARRKIKPGRIPVSELTVPAPSGMTVPAPSGMNWEGIFQEVLVRCFTDSTANMPLICGNGLTWGLGVRF